MPGSMFPERDTPTRVETHRTGSRSRRVQRIWSTILLVGLIALVTIAGPQTVRMVGDFYWPYSGIVLSKGVDSNVLLDYPMYFVVLQGGYGGSMKKYVVSRGWVTIQPGDFIIKLKGIGHAPQGSVEHAGPSGPTKPKQSVISNWDLFEKAKSIERQGGTY